MEKQEAIMLRNFQNQVAKVLDNPKRFIQKGNRIGLESEVALCAPHLSDVELRDVRNSIIAATGFDYELGGSQIEFVTDAHVLSNCGISQLEQQYHSAWEKLLVQARKQNVKVLRSGSIPYQSGINPLRTIKPKYTLVPNYQNINRRKTVDTMFGKNHNIDIGDAAIISLFQAFQVNVEAKDLDHALRMLNWSLMLSPMFMALTANSSWIDCKNTGYHDVRSKVWEISHDTRTKEEYEQGLHSRMGLPENYFQDLQSYFARMERFPFILDNPEAALQVGVGLCWLDARLKIINDSAVVELRSMATQPSITDEIGLALLYSGILAYAEFMQMPLIQFSHVIHNRESSSEHGLRGMMYNFDGQLLKTTEVIENLFAFAKVGLEKLNLSEEFTKYVHPLKMRLTDGTPSELFNRAIQNKQTANSSELIVVLEQTGMIH